MEPQGRPIRPDRVAIYIRWSTEEQSDGTTLAEQREGCEYYVRSQGWQVNPALVFIDDGYSGGSLDRPGMARLRALVRQGAVDCAVVLKIDRLSRNIVDATQLVLNEWAGRCHLRCVRQPIDTTSETGRMFFAILATFADFERAQIAERTTQGRVRRVREGKAYGARVVPYGLLATGDPGVRRLDPAKAPVVAELFRKVREDRATPRELQAWLEAAQIPPPEGAAWHLNTIRRLLRNPIYAGRIVYGKTVARKKAGRRTPYAERRERPLVEVDAVAVPAIVSPEMFDAVQAILAERTAFHRQHRRAAGSANLLTGLARCRCGAAISIHWSRGRRYYQCSRQLRLGAESCSAGCGNLSVEPVDQAIVADLLRSFGQQRVAAQAESVFAAEAAARAKVAAELQRIDRRIAELRQAASLGELSLTEWRVLTETAEARRAEVGRRLSELETAAAGDDAVQVAQQLDRWADLDPSDQKELLSSLAESVELYKPKGGPGPYEVRVVWRF
jgi:site-specific DNA recombinase